MTKERYRHSLLYVYCCFFRQIHPKSLHVVVRTDAETYQLDLVLNEYVILHFLLVIAHVVLLTVLSRGLLAPHFTSVHYSDNKKISEVSFLLK